MSELGLKRVASGRARMGLFLLLALLLGIFFLSAALGKYPLSLRDILSLVWARLTGAETQLPRAAPLAFWNIRMPRILLGLVVGAGLSLSGASFQAIFRNPLVSPDVLGASSGAGFGAALAILLGLGAFMISAFAFAFGMLSIVLVMLVARRARVERILGLILTGIIVSALFSALLSFLKYAADPQNQLPAITYWLMGSLNGTYQESYSIALLLISLGSATIILLAWPLHLLSMGDDAARSLGLEVPRLRLILLLAATLNTAAAVAVSGMIAWVGLVIPHFARLILGAEHRRMLPATALLGASFMLLVDDLSRLLAESEIPLGILTAFVGAPFFLYLICREGRRSA